jgi:hypothetical protein
MKDKSYPGKNAPGMTGGRCQVTIGYISPTSIMEICPECISFFNHFYEQVHTPAIIPFTCPDHHWVDHCMEIGPHTSIALSAG